MTHFKLRKMTSGTRQCLKFYHKAFAWMSYVNWFVKLCQINYMDAIKNSCNRSIKFGWLAYTGSVYEWNWYETGRLKKRVFSGVFSINFPWNCPHSLGLQCSYCSKACCCYTHFNISLKHTHAKLRSSPVQVFYRISYLTQGFIQALTDLRSSEVKTQS